MGYSIGNTFIFVCAKALKKLDKNYNAASALRGGKGERAQNYTTSSRPRERYRGGKVERVDTLPDVQ